jgi:hypothetical protein
MAKSSRKSPASTGKRAGKVSLTGNGSHNAPAENTAKSGHSTLQEQIRRRAYELYEERGRVEGYEHEDWVRAESEVLAQYDHEKSA